MTYRAEVSSTLSTSSSQIVSYIEEWLTDGGLVTFNFSNVTVNSFCQISLSSFSDLECDVTQSVEFSDTVVGGIVGVVIIVLFVLMVTIIAFYQWMKQQITIIKRRNR